MKKILIAALLVLLAVNINCGGGSSGGSFGTSLVTINVGNSSSGKAMALLYKEPSPYIGIAAIPSNVYKIVFTIAAPDMSTITKEVIVAGQATIKESFSVRNGNNRYILVEAKNASGIVLYRDDITVNLVGEPVTLIMYMKAVDTTAPTVISTSPENNATDVPITSVIIITFSETIDPATFNSSTFTLRDEVSDVTGTIAVNGALVTFTPSSNLAYDTTYTGTISTGVRDLVGNAMAADYTWSFMTGTVPDTTPPTVTAVSPGIDATDVPITSTLTATFSEAMDESTVNASTFTLMDSDSNTVSGIVTYAGTTATFTPSSNLAPGITYTAKISIGVRDLTGNAMAADYTWSFTTTVPDTIPPTFGGLVSATAVSTTEIQLQWNPATDNITPASNITYLIYMATTSGGQNYASPSYSVMGITSTTISGLTPCTTYYFVVRAMDVALNTETNTVERSATTECIAWARTYGGLNTDVAYSVQQTSDGGYIVAGYTTSFGAAYNFWVLKLNSTGEIEWQNRYGGPAWEEANSIQQTSDGGYIVAGFTNSFGAGNRDFWVLKLNSAGGIQYQHTYGGTGWDEATSVQQTSDGGYIVAGFTNSFGAGNRDFWILKLNSTLDTVQYQHAYGGTGWDEATSVQQTSDGGYIVAGYTDSFGAGNRDFWVLKLNSDLSIVWQRTFSANVAGWEEARSVRQTTGGGYIVAGDSYTDIWGAFNRDFWVLLLSADGIDVIHRAYGGFDDDSAYSISQTSDGGFIVAGSTYSYGVGGTACEGPCRDFWVLKTYGYGTLGCMCTGTTGISIVFSDATDNTTSILPSTPTITETNTTGIGQNTSATVYQQCP